MRRPAEDTSKNALIQQMLEAQNIAIVLILLIAVFIAANTFLF